MGSGVAKSHLFLSGGSQYVGIGAHGHKQTGPQFPTFSDKSLHEAHHCRGFKGVHIKYNLFYLFSSEIFLEHSEVFIFDTGEAIWGIAIGIVWSFKRKQGLEVVLYHHFEACMIRGPLTFLIL